MDAKRKNLIAGMIFAAGILFVFTGVRRGEADTVFIKAINICLECIGIG